ncbi:GNAT family protein [uncultured Roseobacter sp.]|uniref:GNAT family N-acetyltransferase n=1 Tax=uncultured Roseobacter sp. TaxID=114847 RepID=UPI0026248FE8|nr:GNAT family protein [uncultured Roseobacter sp.]
MIPDGQSPQFGAPVPDWRQPPAPAGAPLSGHYVTLEALDPAAHATDLFRAFHSADAVWDYLPYGPFPDFGGYQNWLRETVAHSGHLFYAIRNEATGNWEGVASYLRIDPANGSIEVGNINYSPALQRTRAATEAMYLLMKWAFENGYRRYEWKCNALNLPSRRAAQRLGFSYEGVFRQATIVKGCNRDTAWFAAIDSEWPRLEQAFQAWLSPDNFDGAGRQITDLGTLTRPVRVSSDPALVG